MKQEDLLFILGAPRSGTHLTADLINKNTSNIFYIGEVNEVWKQYIPFQRTDWIPKKYATKTVRKKLLNKFEKLYRKNNKGSLNGLLMEKTPANTIRFPFLAKLFPKSTYVHIIRDGRDVALSYRKKAQGNVKKITKRDGSKVGFKDRFTSIYQRFEHKRSHGLTFKTFFEHFPRYWRTLLLQLGLIDQTKWGAQIPGMDEYFNGLTNLEMGSLLWRECIITVRNFKAAHKELRFFEFKYEDLVSQPEDTLSKLFDFLPSNRTQGAFSYDIIAGDNTWRKKLNAKEKKLVAEHIENVLLSLDYEPTKSKNSTEAGSC